MRHEIGVGDEHARRVGMGAENADRLAGLDEQRLIALEAAQGRDDAVERRPVARRPPDAAINNKLARPLGDVGIEIVHEHPERRFGQPALGAELGSVGRADDAHVVDAGWRGHGISPFREGLSSSADRRSDRGSRVAAGCVLRAGFPIGRFAPVGNDNRVDRLHEPLTSERIASRTRLIVARVGAARFSSIGVGQFSGAGRSGSCM